MTLSFSTVLFAAIEGTFLLSFPQCYVCGNSGHISSDCTEADGEEKKRMCYTCKSTEHISRDCPDNPAGGDDSCHRYRGRGTPGGRELVGREGVIADTRAWDELSWICR